MNTEFVNIIVTLKSKEAWTKFVQENAVDNFRFFLNSSKDIIWDYVIVFESIDLPVKLKCKKGGLVFITGEPSEIKPYFNSFLKQFNIIITTQNLYGSKYKVIQEQILLPMFGMNYITGEYRFSNDELKDMPRPNKIKDISVIVSDKLLKNGHRIRRDFLSNLKNEFEGKVDFWGNSVNRPTLDKIDAILPYKFHIAIENCSIPHYWTEKIMDPIIGYSVPIYCGCTNIQEYFSEESMCVFNMSNMGSIRSILYEILRNPEEEYKNRLPYLLNARKELFSTYSFCERIGRIIRQIGYNSNRPFQNHILKPENSYLEFKYHNFVWNVKQKLVNKFDEK